MAAVHLQDITVHFRFKSSGPDAPAISAAAVHDWLKHSANAIGFAREHGAKLEVMISDGHCTDVIDFDGTDDDMKTTIMDPQ